MYIMYRLFAVESHIQCTKYSTNVWWIHKDILTSYVHIFPLFVLRSKGPHTCLSWNVLLTIPGDENPFHEEHTVYWWSFWLFCCNQNRLFSQFSRWNTDLFSLKDKLVVFREWIEQHASMSEWQSPPMWRHAHALFWLFLNQSCKIGLTMQCIVIWHIWVSWLFFPNSWNYSAAEISQRSACVEITLLEKEYLLRNSL